MSNAPISSDASANLQPIRFISDADKAKAPQPGIALCLSGGGYRAMLFHLGALWRLNEAGLLKILKRVSSVSGGSITAGMLAKNQQVCVQQLESTRALQQVQVVSLGKNARTAILAHDRFADR